MVLGVHSLFRFAQTNRNRKYTLLINRYPGRQEINLKKIFKNSKTKLYMHNTKGDVTLTVIRRETKY